jgi:hypothetical protein
MIEAMSEPPRPDAVSARWPMWLCYSALTVVLLATVWTFSAITMSSLLRLAALAGLLFVLLLSWLWWHRLVVPRILARGGRRIVPAVVVVVLVLGCAGVPRQVRWALGRPAFDRFAAAYAADPDLRAPDWLGSYRIVAGPYPVPGGFRLLSGTSGLFDDAGFAYLPGGPPADLGNGAWENPVFRHLTGPWYSWTASW